jgi:hypothetical protein
MPTPAPKFTADERALILLADVGQWGDVKLQDGSHAYAIPSESRPGVYHISNGKGCDCPAFSKVVDYSGTAPACKHMLAVQRHNVEILAMLPTLRPDGDMPTRAEERAQLARDVYRPAAQEILTAAMAPLTRRRQANMARKYHQIFDTWGQE